MMERDDKYEKNENIQLLAYNITCKAGNSSSSSSSSSSSN